MAYYLCEEHQLAFPTWNTFRGHYFGKHRGESLPERETVEVEEIPEGFSLYQKRERRRAAREEAPEEEEELRVPEELPEDLFARAEMSMRVHQIPDKLRQHAINVLRLHPEATENPNNFANLLASIFGSSIQGRRQVGKLGLITSEVFEGQAGAQQPYFAMPQQQTTPYTTYAGPQSTPVYAPYGAPQPPPYTPYSSYPPYPPPYPYPHYEERRREREDESREGIRRGYREREPSPEVIELRRRVDEREQQIDDLVDGMKNLQQLLRKQEEDAKEERHRQEIEKLATAHQEELKSLRSEYTEQLERIQQSHKEELARIEARLAQRPAEDTTARELREEIKSLRESLHSRELAGLEEKIRALESREPTSPTELGVIQHTADRTVDAITKAGSDLKTIVTAQQAAQQIPPGRRTPEQREQLGEALIEQSERRAEARKLGEDIFERGA